MHHKSDSAKFILLGLPIGNTDDITKRVLNALKNEQIFFVEDTRRFKTLLKNLNIDLNNKKIFSFHDHSNTENCGENILKFLEQGHNVYYASDAGSPVLSDPGFELMQLAWDRGWNVDSYSGISSMTMALELSGFTSTPMSFHGFSSREGSKQRDFLKKDLAKNGSHIWFEPPHRVEKVLNLLKEIWPENEIFVGRELTKTYQSLHKFKLGELAENEIIFKGEFVLILAQKNGKKEVISDELLQLAEDIKTNGPAQKKVAKLLAKILNLPAKELYHQWTHDKN